MEKQKAEELVAEFMEKKVLRGEYIVYAIFTPNYDDDVVFPLSLHDNTVNRLRAMKAKSSIEEYLKYIPVVLKEEKEVFYMNPDIRIKDIDLDSKRQLYNFSVHEVYGKEVAYQRRTSIELTPEEYSELLVCRLVDVRFTINTLRLTNPALYVKIMDRVDDIFRNKKGKYVTSYVGPYVVVMDDVNSDAFDITREDSLEGGDLMRY